MAYGLRLGDGSNTKILTPDDLTIISAGSVSMPASLNGDNTYGTDIDLPGTGAIPVANLGVLVVSRRPNFNSICYRVPDAGEYGDFHFADDVATYYTRNDSTGVMTSWSAGNMSPNLPSEPNFDQIISVFPIAFWDKMGATTFTAIRLFAASCYLLRDGSTGDAGATSAEYGTNIKVYSIGSNGVDTVDYLITLKRWNY